MKRNISRINWLDYGLKTLAKEGARALKAEPLAKSLHVSRGSFYWHFKDIDDFHRSLIIRWREVMTKNIIVEVNQEALESKKLNLLMRKALTNDDDLERALRAWGTQEKFVAAAIYEVDRIRFDYLTEILKESNVPKRQIRARAAFIYWAVLGRVMAGSSSGELNLEELDLMAELFTSN